ncbi:hypothetical protein FZEAL_2347 [Fusarium zealandicum]|uniref:Uncharacterized protein n=1 Tax=Fusarium zealandicum TaxID=1053134 RepID=A0A8H4URM4_9HYPO|nr:hypothetical protein FZEAL_2347 [Fusarium zealandicum]
MEQQGSDTPCISSAVLRDTESRSTRQPLSSSPSALKLTPTPQRRSTTPASRPTTPAINTSTTATTTSSGRNPLSTSEPTLRFPRPQGNRHLANWISSSNPDIMRVITTTEDTGLSESTYELISGTDTESQDGNYTGSISESVGSLDINRPDDVHSLAGTEPTNDDESVADESIADEYEPLSRPSPQDSDEGLDTAVIQQTPQPHQSWASIVKDGPLPEPEPETETKAETEPESEDEARSRSSLEYTQQSLKTPSIPTPDASNILDKPAQEPLADDATEDAESRRARFNKWLADVQNSETRPWQSLVDAAISALPGLIFTLVLAALIPVFYSPPWNNAVPHNPAVTSVVTTHPTPLSLTASRVSSTTTQSLSTSTGVAGLVPLENALPDEWIFGSKRPDVTVTRHRGDFLFHMPQDVKRSWLDRKCLSFSAKRGDEIVRFNTSSVDQGMLLKFPKEEAHGTLKVDIYTTCRPKIRKILRITFEKGIISEALELTKAFAQNLPDLVPAAAQEAERRLEGAKRSVERASDNVMLASDSLFKTVSTKFKSAHQSLGWIKMDIQDRVRVAKEDVSKRLEDAADQVMQHLSNAGDVQQQARIGLLDAQLSAKLWWLKLTAGEAEHKRYQIKAKELMVMKLAETKYAQKLTHGEAKREAHPPRWTKMFGGVRCEKKAWRQRKGLDSCEFVA